MTTRKVAASAKASDSEARKTALRTAYGQATKRLREAHREEFNTLYSEAAKENGVEWSPRPTEEQQAEALFDDLLVKYPQLRERVSTETEDNDEDKEGATDDGSHDHDA